MIVQSVWLRERACGSAGESVGSAPLRGGGGGFLGGEDDGGIFDVGEINTLKHAVQSTNHRLDEVPR